MTFNTQHITGLRVGNKSVRTIIDSQLILPTVTVSGTWNPLLTDCNKHVIISGEVELNGKTDCYSLTFEQGGHLTLNPGSRLRIWEGGIKNDDCETVNYFQLKQTLTKEPFADMAQLLIHPSVNFNNHPLASIDLISWSYNKIRTFRFSCFLYDGITISNLEKINHSYGGYYYYYDYVQNQYVNITTSSYLLLPFEFYSQNCMAPTAGFIYRQTGRLYGNINKTITIHQNDESKFYVNSYTGKLDIYPLKNHLIEQGYEINYFSKLTDIDNNKWIEILEYNRLINPMQSFGYGVVSKEQDISFELNYAKHVWEPSLLEDLQQQN